MCGGDTVALGSLVGRRDALGGLIALPLLMPGFTLAQGIAGASRRPADWTGPSYARSMSSDVTGALLSLISAYGAVATEIGKLQERQRELAEKLAVAVRDKAIRLQEYRNGEFCSGCNQTKSEILAKGERFPHDGQRVITPTDEQIAAKERQLQAIIDRLAEELKKVRARLAEIEPNISEIKSQLFDGMGLWRTANVFERRLIRQEDAYDAQDYLAQRGEVLRIMATVQKAAVAPTQDVDTLKRTAANLEDAIGVLKRLDTERAADVDRVEAAMIDNVTNAQSQVARVDAAAKDQAGKITAFGLAGYLNILTVPMTPNIDPRPMVGESAGMTFRMGRYGREGWGEILPRVAEFVARARNLQSTGAGGAPAGGGVELSRAESLLARLRSRVTLAEREAAEAKRQAEAKRAAEEAEAKRQQTEAIKVPETPQA